jgi:hypothetical protein
MRYSNSLMKTAGLLLVFGMALAAAGPPGATSLTNKRVKYKVGGSHTAALRRGDVEAIIVDNEAFGADHKKGYNGVASLKHKGRGGNVFVPSYAGLNFELIFDGTNAPRDVMFEPRRAPMELRVVNARTVELYQAPTPTWKLESATRFEIERDGAIHMTFECIPRARVFKNNWIGLFWASYIDKPGAGTIHFRGRERGARGERWIEAASPSHGVQSTHLPAGDTRVFQRAPDFPPHWMAFSFSNWEYTQPFYFGFSRGLGLLMEFRRQDRIWFTQSPSGGGKGNPAWDFQFYIEDYKVDTPYGFEMRLAYAPFIGQEKMKKLHEKLARRWRQ